MPIVPEVSIVRAAKEGSDMAERVWHHWAVGVTDIINQISDLMEQGYDGSVTVVTSIDFGAQTYTTATLTFEDGILTSVT